MSQRFAISLQSIKKHFLMQKCVFHNLKCYVLTSVKIYMNFGHFKKQANVTRLSIKDSESVWSK